MAYLELKERRGNEPPPEAWELAISKRDVAEYKQDLIGLEELSERVDEHQDTIEKLGDIRATPREGYRKKKDHRASALSRIFAFEALHRDEVESFRRDLMAGNTIALDEVEDWVATRAAMDGRDTTWVTLPRNDDGTFESPIPEGQYTEFQRILYYLRGPDMQLGHKPVRSGETLDRLRRIAESLYKIYGWSEAWATTFVLTDEVPPVVDLHWVINQPWPWWKARRSITITAPLWISPKQVAELYQTLRRRALRGDGFPRSLGEKTAELAVFSARHNKGRTWWKTMRLWNAKNTDWQYEDEAMFTRDCREAFKRITGDDLHWEGKDE